jgi:serine/threonine-protein kinase RsbW
LKVPAQVTHAALVRVSLKAWLVSLGASEDQTFAILLAVNEAVANAIQHAHNPMPPTVAVSTRHEDGMVEVAVRDHGAWSKDAREGYVAAGMSLMAALMDNVNVLSDHRGTTVLLTRRLQTSHERAQVGERRGAATPATEPETSSS